MAILHKLLFFLVLGLICAGAFALTLEFLAAGGYTHLDFKEALRCAQQGHVSTQFTLGLMYECGLGVPRDYILSHMRKDDSIEWDALRSEQLAIARILTSLGDEVALPGDADWQNPPFGTDDAEVVRMR